RGQACRPSSSNAAALAAPSDEDRQQTEEHNHKAGQCGLIHFPDSTASSGPESTSCPLSLLVCALEVGKRPTPYGSRGKCESEVQGLYLLARIFQAIQWRELFATLKQRSSLRVRLIGFFYGGGWRARRRGFQVLKSCDLLFYLIRVFRVWGDFQVRLHFRDGIRIVVLLSRDFSEQQVQLRKAILQVEAQGAERGFFGVIELF